jgi:4-amino-4-deoxy-L-arabinose transferase-like glycosyltransferase
MDAVRTALPRHEGLRDAVMLVAALTAVRLVALFVTPLELYPDEAQYWLWSRELAFGYFSKPPMIAWAIWATTSLGGDAEAWVRLSAALFQAGAALMVFLIGRRLFDARVGLAGAALYALMPGVQLSALVAATDAPLLFFLGVFLWSYVAKLRAEGRRKAGFAIIMGLALGLAFLSKYAAVYAVIGLVLHAATSAEARAAWRPRDLGLFLLALSATLAPNLAWNASHGFATFEHTASNAAWSGVQLFNPGELATFLISQFGVFGPIPMGALAVGVVLAIRKRKLSAPDLLLICFTLPPLLIVCGQAFISRANANWSGAGYLAGSVLVAAWLLRWRARGWLMAGLGVQSVIAAAFLTLIISPALADRAGLANGLKRARGWSDTADLILDRAARDPSITAIAVNNRFLFYATAYYGRAAFEAGAPPLVSWLLMEGPRNQAETVAPLTPALGGRVLAVSFEGWRRPEMEADFARASGLEIGRVRLDPERRRKVEMFIGEGFAPRPRDPVSGLPVAPAPP